MRSYKNASQDLIACLEKCNFIIIPRLDNYIANYLATSIVGFKVPMHPSGKYEIEVRNRPFVPDNVKSWQVFEDDKQIQKFLTLTGEFDGLTIDEENEHLEEAPPTQEPLQIQTTTPK